MNEPYDDEDDGYDDDQYNYEYNDQYDPYKFYFKFDVDSNSSLSDWLNNLFKDIYSIQNIPGFPIVSFPVNSWNSNTAKDNSFQYLGSNYHGVSIWKKKYFVSDPINIEYKLHLQAHAKHFIQQPSYYQGLFDILN
jgi:hypothetical protein